MALPSIGGVDMGAALSAIAEQIYPLAAWVGGPDKFIPPEQTQTPGGLPWRKPGNSLSVQSLKLMEGFDELLAQPGAGDYLVVRWNGVKQNPLANWPLVETATQWRTERGLPPSPSRFSPEASDNFEYVEGTGDARKPVARKNFYDRCFVQLAAVVTKQNPGNAKDWEKVLGDLRADKEQAWDAGPTGTGGANVQSSAFLKRFALDLSTLLLGPRPTSSGLGGQWNFAMQIELGEHRKPGNAFTVGDARDATEAFRAKVVEGTMKTMGKN